MDILLYALSCAGLILMFVTLIAVLRGKEKAQGISVILSGFRAELERRFDDIARQNGENSYRLRKEVMETVSTLGANTTAILSESSKHGSEAMDKLKNAVEQKLKDLSETSEKRLVQIQKAVDDELSDLLQKRLTGSFKQVSDQLEQVFRSMGEVKSLAAGVVDLKRVLSNVKVRGTWGEIQLGNLISSMLSPSQYIHNADVKGTSERVEYAIVLPGGAEGRVLLPIDSKFPMEDYLKKEEVLDSGNRDLARDAMKFLARSMLNEAKRISGKYINPPETTDFAVMYLPTEGLYADAITLGISDICQRDHHVTIAGPSTLSALLNSLQMGFRTLAIERQSGEVMKMLEAVKKAFSEFTFALDRTKKSLAAAQNNLDDASRKSRNIEKQLRCVESGEEALSIEE